MSVETNRQARSGERTPDLSQAARELCHDLRQPIAAIMSLAAAAQVEAGDARTVRLRMEQIIREAMWLSRVMEPVASSGPGPWGDVFHELADLGDIAGEVAEVVGATFPGVIDVERETGVLVAAPPAVVRRVLHNLVDNAARAAGDGGTVTIVVGAMRRLAVVDVCDDGPGFGKVATGSGVGLAMCRRFLASYGGRLLIDTGPMGGVRATVTLPRVDTTGASRG